MAISAVIPGSIILLLISSAGNCYSWTSDRPHGNTSVEYMLKQTLLRGYDTTSRPVRKDSSPVDTRVGMSLFHILDTSERHQTISAQVSIRVHWWDEYLTWDVSQYPIKKFWIPAKSIWRPDLIITNYANDEYSDYMNTNAIVELTGKIMWTFPIVVKMYCTLDVRYFPFDRQDCNVTFVSWTYDGFQVALNHTGKDDQKVYYNARNQEWKVTGIKPYQELIKYPCCESPFPVIHFTIRMHRRCLFYVINLICPCLLIYFVSFLGFYLPIESGEKVNLEITVLLALVVFLLMVSETMPPTPDAIPILGLLFTVTMTMVALAVVMAVTVTRVYFSQQQVIQRHQQRHHRPAWIARLARLHRQWTAAPAASPKPQQQQPSSGFATSRLAGISASGCGNEGGGGKRLLSGQGRAFNTSLEALEGLPPSASYFKGALTSPRPPQSASPLVAPAASLNGDAGKIATVQQQEEGHSRSSCQHQLLEDRAERSEDWKLAAFALDRIFFWLFTALTTLMFLVICGVASPAFTDEAE